MSGARAATRAIERALIRPYREAELVRDRLAFDAGRVDEVVG